jgi:7-carboxy-7-deazaguanine synthase
VEARDLAEWILEDHLPVRLQLQLHKLLWGDVPGK